MLIPKPDNFMELFWTFPDGPVCFFIKSRILNTLTIFIPSKFLKFSLVSFFIVLLAKISK